MLPRIMNHETGMITKESKTNTAAVIDHITLIDHPHLVGIYSICSKNISVMQITTKARF